MHAHDGGATAVRAHDPQARARHLPGGQNRIRSPAPLTQLKPLAAAGPQPGQDKSYWGSTVTQQSSLQVGQGGGQEMSQLSY